MHFGFVTVVVETARVVVEVGCWVTVVRSVLVVSVVAMTEAVGEMVSVIVAVYVVETIFVVVVGVADVLVGVTVV